MVVKRTLKIAVGASALVVALMAFFFAQDSGKLEVGFLKNWHDATLERRVAAVQILTATDENLELLVACVDKMATLPDSGEMAVRDAVSLCHTGIKLKESI